MRGRGANVMVLAAKQQVLSSLLHGTQRASHPSLCVKSTRASTPWARLLQSWTLHEQSPSPASGHHRIQSLSTAASQAAPAAAPEPEPEKSKDNEKPDKPAMEESHYWGIVPKTLHKEDGTPWKWTCFSPHQAYHPDTTIDLELHHKRKTWADSIAYWTVKSLRFPTDLFFQKRYGCRAMMLETVAAVPGMVGGMLLHCKSLRRFETSGGWIKALLEEAENERMHLMTFMEVAQPKWWERALVFTVQGVWFNAYFLTYIISPRFAHRLTGYLEEEAIWSYSHFLQEIDNGHIPNGPAPAIAIDYWRLPANATIRDVVIVVRADEAHHRDVNHFAADLHEQGKELRESPAPLGFK